MNILLKVDVLRRGISTANLIGAVKSISKRNLRSGIRLLQEEQEQAATLDEDVENVEPLTNDKGTIGFIGLGDMGLGMGMNLLNKGYNLVIYDTNTKAMEPFILKGATAASSPEHVAQQVSKIITMLPSSTEVKDVYDGKLGIFRGIQEGTLLIESSTLDPSISKEMSKLTTPSKSTYIDAPVLGGVMEAQDGTLTCMCGGSVDDFDIAKEILSNIATNVLRCGGVGCGQSAKICNNMLTAISMIGTSEVMNLGIRLGLDKKALSHLLNISTGRCWSSEKYNPCPDVISGIPSSNSYQGGYSSQQMAKDLELAQNASTATRSVAALGGQAHSIYQLMCKSGYSKSDFSSVYKFLREL